LFGWRDVTGGFTGPHNRGVRGTVEHIRRSVLVVSLALGKTATFPNLLGVMEFIVLTMFSPTILVAPLRTVHHGTNHDTEVYIEDEPLVYSYK
jgi:hypothetical protein